MPAISLIIPCAGAPTNPLTSTYKDINNDILLPMHGKNVLQWNLETAFANGIDQVILVADKNSASSISRQVDLFFPEKDVTVLAKKTTSLGDAVSKGLKVAKHPSALIVFGDTIFLGKPVQLENNWMTYRTDYLHKGRFCRVKIGSHGFVQTFIDKNPVEDPNNRNVVSGVVYIRNAKKLFKALKKHKQEFYPALTEFSIVAREDRNVFDCGNIDNYYLSKAELLQTRSFNNIEYNPLYGTIIKRSTNSGQLMNEARWYKKLPKELQSFVPRLIEVRPPSEYTLEYYSYPSLGEHFVHHTFEEDTWIYVLEQLLEIKEEFNRYSVPVNKGDLKAMYIDKMKSRVRDAKKNKDLKELFEMDEILLNRKRLKGFPQLEKKFYKKLKEYMKTVDRSHVIHGDFIFLNILFDPNNKLVKLVDPRGLFGSDHLYGDKNYDLAKLRHSVDGLYEFIVSDRFVLTQRKNSFTYRPFQRYYRLARRFDELLEREADLEDIKLIEAALFLSMIPLHSDSLQRQKAMFITGMRLLNEVL